MACTITSWTYVPEPKENELFMAYELKGEHDGRDFHIKVSIEIDGRDGIYEQISSPDMDFNSDDDDSRNRRNDLLIAMNWNEALSKDMRERSEAYYAA